MAQPNPSALTDGGALLLSVHTPLDRHQSICKRAEADVESKHAIAERLDKFVHRAINHSTLAKPTTKRAFDDEIESAPEIGFLHALGALRVERSRPFDALDGRAAVPSDSYRREMRYWPLWKNPGLSKMAQSLRDYFISHIKQVFWMSPAEVQRRVVSAILVSDSHATHDSEDSLPVTTVDDQTILLNEDALSLRCSAEARSFETPANLPDIQVKDGVVEIPCSIWERKLETYAHFGWAKLTHAYYQIVDSRLLAYCVREGERVRDEIVKYLETKHGEELYGTCYGANSPTEYKDSATLLDSGIAPSKRLTNIVDAVRAHPEGSFDGYYTPDQLFAMVCDILPAPHRPSTALSTANAVQDGLERSYSPAVRDRKTTDRHRTGGVEVEYKIEEPGHTPFYRPQEDQLHLWVAYERVLENQRQYRYDASSEDHPYSVSGSLGTQDIEGTTASDAPVISQARDQAHHAAVCEPLAVDSPSDVPIHAQPDEFSECSADEIEFLTRVGYAMTGLIDGYSLTQPMSRLTDESEEQLSVDLDKLENKGHVEIVDELEGIYYEIPYSVRMRLMQTSLSHESRPSSNDGQYDDPRYGGITHEGYAESHPAETTSHRVGVAQMATALSDLVANPTAHRYYDFHRLGPERIPLQGFRPDVCELSRKTANVYGLDSGATAAAIPLSQLDDRLTTADRHNLTLGDIDLSDSQYAGESLAMAGLDDLTLEDLGLDNYRDRTLDVAVFDGDTLMHVAEVQRRSGVKSRTRRNFSKLKALGELGVTAHWCCPTITDLRSVMSQLDHPDYLDFENRPNRSPDTDRPSLWRRKLSTANLWQPGIETLSTHRSIEVMRDD